ncbi:autotransporter outer membrane beta-barrel domain-containing protein [Phyllobacterium lublinensis]|uniref:autotransporter outer membrane beta-barrel domain-containing protein n=1 Tax=Phyllobacterium lublinensis TaxID=2875708 RepID=UPI001CCFBA7B|nr:autotransporter outer membrane beta-barrel domain-containing protein [Phyllobacterium sp. 2063]MBZ9655771.1 autotransporter domain-containing protein [Phyllobacterium sp. 2063]
MDLQQRLCSKSIIFLAALFPIAGSPALAANCKSSGGLVYLGNTSDGTKSVWLSGTAPGSFSLEAAQGNTTVDTWDRSKRGLHVSASPFVSSGNGGTHKLYDVGDSKPCLIDTQNQKGGFTIPPNITLPMVTLPGRVLPPIGTFFPDFKPPTPPSGVTPGRPSMPNLPQGVRPPIATLPPSGLTPGVSGGVRPPVGRVPAPGGITPGRPTMPNLPQGARPPVAALPPSGLTPRVPGAVRPPVGTLPPGGVTPGVPGTGGSATLTPGRPTMPNAPQGVVNPPAGTLPPDSTLPSNPGGVQTQGQKGGRVVASPPQKCIDPRSATPAQAQNLPICPQETLAAIAARYGTVPLTEGRDLVQSTLWNAWAEGSLIGTSDGRYGLDVDTRYGSVTFGLDRRLTDDVVAGLSFAIEDSRTTGYGDLLKADTNGISVGPYVAVRLSPHWAVDASLTYGQYDNQIELSILDGSYDSQRYSGSVTFHGQYTMGEYFVRPKASVSYAHIASDQYKMSGDIFGLPINVRFPEDDFNYGVLEASTEFSRIFNLDNGKYVMPFAEIGANYEFERPNGGQILTGDLKEATPSPWSFLLRAGARMLLTDSFQLEASAGYLSFGQGGLDVWEGKLHLSYAF